MAKVSPTKASRLARNIAYPHQIWWAIASFLALLTLLHLTNLLVLFIQRKKALALIRKKIIVNKNDPEKAHHSEGSSYLERKAGFLRRLEAAAREPISILLHRYTVPIGTSFRVTGVETFIVISYTVMILTWTFVNCYNSDTGLKIDPLFYANRAGIIAISQMPLLVLLAGKNNLISLITGISFEKLHIFHRAIARVCLILLLVHTGGRLHLGVTPDESSTAWLKLGYVALAVWIVSVIILIRPLRARFYNIVFIIHLFMSLIAIITTYYHVKKSNGNPVYLIPAIVFWGFDRVLRVSRILWNSRGDPSSPTTTANKAEIISSDLIKLSIHQRMSWKAGQSAYITLSRVSILPFEAHPFTIVTLPATKADKKGKEKKEKHNGLNELVFLIRVRNGFTRRLYRAITEAQGQNKEFMFRAFIDGPYGSSPDLCSFSDIVIIVGGSGISFGLPVLRETVRAVRDGRSACTSVSFIWVTSTPNINTMTYILENLQNTLENAPESLKIKIQLYNTAQKASVTSLAALTAAAAGGETPKDSESSDSDKTEGFDIEEIPMSILKPLTASSSSSSSSKSESSSSKVKETSATTDVKKGDGKGAIATLLGRPDIKQLLEEKVSLVQTSLSVNVAGPPTMVEDVRKALRFNVITPGAKLKGQPEVHLYTKAYEIA